MMLFWYFTVNHEERFEVSLTISTPHSLIVLRCAPGISCQQTRLLFHSHLPPHTFHSLLIRSMMTVVVDPSILKNKERTAMIYLFLLLARIRWKRFSSLNLVLHLCSAFSCYWFFSLFFRNGWFKSNNDVGGARTNVSHQQSNQQQYSTQGINNGAVSSRHVEHPRSIVSERKRQPPVVTTTVVKNRPPIETILTKLLSLEQHWLSTEELAPWKMWQASLLPCSWIVIRLTWLTGLLINCNHKVFLCWRTD